MKSTVVLFFILTLNLEYCSSDKIQLRKVESVREKLMKAGKWEEYLNEKEKSTNFASTTNEPISTYRDLQYQADIKIGAQTFSVTMDTGSADLWVPGVLCIDCFNKTKYDPSINPNYKKNGSIFHMAYGKGSCTGYLASDTVCIASICVKLQTFGIANIIAPAFIFQQQSGICGMGFQSLSSSRSVPPVQNMITNKLLTNPWFTFWLTSQVDAHGATGGLLTLGDYDKAHCSSQCDWIPLTQAAYYQIALSNVQIGQVVISSGVAQAISDTGTSLIVGPADQIAQINKLLGGKEFKGIYFIDCSLWGNLPPVVFTINGKTYSVSSYSYVLESVVGGNLCMLGFQAMNATNGVSWILGDVWIREYCQVYDMGNKQLGICQNLQPGYTTHVPRYTTPTMPSGHSRPLSMSFVICLCFGLVNILNIYRKI